MRQTKELNWLIALLLMSGISTQSFSQSLKEFFNNSEMQLTYLGIDFTKARLINVPDANSFDIRNRLYGSINDLVVNEPKKFDIAGAFHKSNVSSNLTAVRAKNDKINAEEIVSSNTDDFYRLKDTDIAAVVKALNIDKKNGIGFLFVMEGMKKMDKKGVASIWVVLVDMQSKKVLMTERFESKATGIGFRNYWASTIKETLDEIEKKKYKDWKSTFGS
jgi:DNA integrity scanning protein DisA with diadenylate cyclase activity